MQNTINNKVKLKDVIFMYSEESKQTSGEFLRLWRLAFRGFIKMGLMSFWAPKTILIPVNGNLTATLPGDYIKWVAVGTFNEQGEFQTLRINEDLTIFKDVDPNRISQIQPETNQMADIILWNAWYNGNYTSDSFGHGYAQAPPFGLGSKLLQPGQCKVDEENYCIVLGKNFMLQHVALKYISSPEADDDYAIPLQFQEAMIDWLGWKDIQRIPGKMGMVDRAANIFKASLKVAKKMYEPFRIQEANQYFREAQKLAVKG